jgi:photosystem II stability/assembly factor-like uncharacterized protein
MGFALRYAFPMRALLLAFTLTAATAHAQWDIQKSGTTADLRGIASVDGSVAWASGTNGTVIRTEDAGYLWQRCTIPPGAEKLDFRGVQAFDANTAVVMSSGKGGLSRLYKTTDGCQTWKKVFDDPEETGFFDSLHLVTGKQMYLLGDPVGGKFSMYYSADAGSTWYIADDPGLDAPKDAGAFAASNSALANVGPFLIFGTGGPHAAVYAARSKCDTNNQCTMFWEATDTPLAHGAAASGVFSLAGRIATNMSGKMMMTEIAVGGTYDKSDDAAAAAVFTTDGGAHWTLATAQPHGYRSAVSYDRASTTWITVGPNGTDISTDDGRNWRPLRPSPTDAPDADRNWNALSLPFVVGPHGRVGLLNPAALKKP